MVCSQIIWLSVWFTCIAGSGSEEDSDVLSINADIDDSDIEGHKDVKPEEAPLETPPPAPPVQSSEPKVELQQDIDRSVSEILAPTPPVTKKDVMPAIPERGRTQQPSAQQLELLELEMRARAIKALMKAGEMKKRVWCWMLCLNLGPRGDVLFDFVWAKDFVSVSF